MFRCLAVALTASVLFTMFQQPVSATSAHRLRLERRAVREARANLREARVRFRRARRARRARGGEVPGVFQDCPVAGVVRFSDDFGEPRPGGRVHEGIDLQAPAGRPLVAVFSGTAVRSPSTLGGLGVQLLSPSGDLAYYAHLSSYGAAGRVSAGTVIGRVGSTGDATGPHLHFEYHPGGGEAVDPYSLLNTVC